MLEQRLESQQSNDARRSSFVQYGIGPKCTLILFISLALFSLTCLFATRCLAFITSICVKCIMTIVM